MPIILPDYSKGPGGGLRSMLVQMAKQMADNADDDDEEGEYDSEEEGEEGEETEASADSPITKRRARAALRDISPHLVRQIGYYECLRQFNRNFVRGSYQGMPHDGRCRVSVAMGTALLGALLEKRDWTLEFVLAASERDERKAWDQVVSTAFLPVKDDRLLERYRVLFCTPPAEHSLPSDDEHAKTKALLGALTDARLTLHRIKAQCKEGRCVVCREPAKMRCARCKAVYYCGGAHQKEAWPTHKHTCKPREGDAIKPASEAQKNALLELGCEKVPENMGDADACERKVQEQLGDVLQKLIDFTRNEKMVLYLHQLHVGTAAK